MHGAACSTDSITAELRKLQGSRKRNCLKLKPASDPEDFSVCGNGIVEGDEECDCGFHYQACSDPCCYAAHINPRDQELNRTATPCRYVVLG